MEQQKPLDLNSAIADYLLKKGYVKAFGAFSEDIQADPHSADVAMGKEHTADLLLEASFFTFFVGGGQFNHGQ